MRLKATLKATFAALCVLYALKASAQVAPAAKVSGLPISVGVGVSSYNLDYGPGRRMEGVVARAGVGIFHGLGVDLSARTIFMFTPAELTRMQQTTYLAGVYYQAPAIGRLRPFARYAGGIGTIEFPSRNPFYTRDTYTVMAPSGGVEYQLTHKVALRAEYEYQFWQKFLGPHDLTPQGFTVGVTYSLRGRHIRSHELD